MLIYNSNLHSETAVLTDVKLEDNTTSGKYLIIDSDSDGTALTADRTLTIDVNNADRVLDLGGDLTVEASSIVNQDLSSDASPTFASVHLVDNTTAAYELILDSDSSGTALTADRTLTIDVDNGDRNIFIGADLTVEATSIINQDLSSDADAAFATVATTGSLTTNSGAASGEEGLKLYSINSTYSLITQSDAEGIADKSDLRFAIDEGLRRCIICDRGDAGADLGLSAAANPRLSIYSADVSNSLSMDYNDITFSTSGKIISGAQLTLEVTTQTMFTVTSDLSAFNAFYFKSDAGIELTDTDGRQAWVYVEPKINQSSTGAADALYINMTLTSEGDGTTGDGNNYINCATSGTSNFRIDNTGGIFPSGMKSGANQGAAGAGTGELWVDTSAANVVKLGT
jgi:hypothetical protein